MLLLTFLLLTCARAQSCFLPNGSEAAPEIVPCDPTGEVSSCCNAANYCLSNGLCFNAGGNNLMSQQGCTDRSWRLPCKKYCSGGSEVGVSLFPCQQSLNRSNGQYLYCCGSADVGACCQQSSWFAVPVGTISGRPIVSPTSNANQSSEGTNHTREPNNTGSNPLALRLGLGLGIPLGLILIGSLLYFGWQLQIYNTTKARNTGLVEAQMKDGTEIGTAARGDTNAVSPNQGTIQELGQRDAAELVEAQRNGTEAGIAARGNPIQASLGQGAIQELSHTNAAELPAPNG